MTTMLRTGDVRELTLDQVARTQIVQYAGASGDFSPLHTDEPAAVAAGSPSIMAHGMLTLALSARVLTEWFGDESLVDLGARFTAPVWPGDRLTVTATVTEVLSEGSPRTAELELRTVNDKEQVVLLGTARVTVGAQTPSKKKRA